MTATPTFRLTQKQVTELIRMTPPGRVPQLTISFPLEERKEPEHDPTALVDMSE